MLRNLLIRSGNIYLADREVQTATVTNTLGQTVELNGNTDGDGLLIVHLIEVNVQRSVCHGVELDLLHDSCVLLALDVEADHIDVRSIDELAELCESDGEGQSLGLAINFLLTIKVTRNIAFLTEGLRSFLTKVNALLTCYTNLFHNCVTLN